MLLLECYYERTTALAEYMRLCREVNVLAGFGYATCNFV